MRNLCVIALFAQVCGAVSVDLARFVLHTTDSEVRAVAQDQAGNIYVAGELRGGEFQAQRPLQPDGGLFLIKLDPAGEVLYATPLGTHAYMDTFGGLAVDRSGNVWIAGTSNSSELALTPGARQRHANYQEIFLLRLPASGDRVLLSTWLGGSDQDVAKSLATDAEGNVWIGGMTNSPDFPLTPGAVRWDNTGFDGFLARLRPDGAIAYSTRIGASGWDQISAVTLTSDGAPALLVETGSADFPGVIDLGVPQRTSCVVRLLPDVSAFRYSYCMPAPGLAMAIAAAGADVWVTGVVSSPDLPVTADAQQSAPSAHAWFRLGASSSTGPPAGAVHKLLPVAGAVYAATDRGIFVSRDDGESWQARNTGLDTLSIEDIAAARDDPSRLYAVATVGNRLYRSNDGGETWHAIGRWAAPAYLRVVTVDPHNSSRVFAGGNGLYLSPDGGDTWEQVQWPAQATVAAIAVDPRDPDLVYAGTYLYSPIRFFREGGIYRSTDGGRTFAATDVKSTDATALITADGAIYAAGSQYFYRSTDQGATWTQHASMAGSGYPWDFHGLAIDPAKPGVLWAITGEGLVYRSSDGGDSFEPIASEKRFARAGTIAVMPDGAVHAGGFIAGDVFLAKLDGMTGQPRYMTYFGGLANEHAQTIAVDAAGNVAIGGHTWSTNLPGLTTQISNNEGLSGGFVAAFHADGSLWFSTYTGEASTVAAVAAGDRVLAAGMAGGGDFPLIPGPSPGYQRRAFVIGLK